MILALSLSGKTNLIKVKFFPDTYPQYFITLEAPISTPLSVTNEYLLKITDEIKKNGKGEYGVITGTAGWYSNEDYQPIFGYQYGMLVVTMPDSDAKKFADYPVNDPKKHLQTVFNRVRPLVPEEVKISIRPSYEGPPRGKPVSLRIFGQNEKEVTNLAHNLLGFMQNSSDLKGLINISTDMSESRKVATMKTNNNKTKTYGLTPTDILTIGAGLIDGQIVGKFRSNREDVDLKVMIDERELIQPEDILNIPIIEDSKSPILISDVASFEYLPEISALNRYNEQRSIEITADIDESFGLTPQMVVSKMDSYYQTISHNYNGAQLSFEGEFKATQNSYDSLQMAFLIALMLIYVILAWLFQSYLQPFIIISTIFFAFVGVILGLLFTGENFTLNVFMGVVGLAGVSANDSIVLLDFINKARKKGKSLRESIIDGCGVRMRAIILTTATTVFGLLPTALGIPEYSPAWSGMAVSFISGLIVSTFLTMLMIPVIYEIVESIKIKIFGRDQYVKKKLVIQNKVLDQEGVKKTITV